MPLRLSLQLNTSSLDLCVIRILKIGSLCCSITQQFQHSLSYWYIWFTKNQTLRP